MLTKAVMLRLIPMVKADHDTRETCLREEFRPFLG